MRLLTVAVFYDMVGFHLNHPIKMKNTKQHNKIAVLFNPSSGKGRSIKQKEKVETALKNHDIDYDLWVTKSEGHLRQLTVEAAGKYNTIVGVGGDTTFNIIATEIPGILNNNNIKKKENINRSPVIGMISTGSANDIVRGLGTTDINSACNAIKKRNVMNMDIGRLSIKGNSKPILFLGTLSMGLGTTVNQYVEQFHQNHKRLAALPLFNQLIPGLTAIQDSFKTKKIPLNLKMEYDTEETNGTTTKTISQEIECSLLVFLNTPYYANGLKMVKTNGTLPEPTLFDGLLDCCIINTKSFFQTLKAGISIKRGTNGKNNAVTMIRSHHFKITGEKSIDIQVDGEIIEKVNELDVSVLPGALKVITV